MRRRRRAPASGAKPHGMTASPDRSCRPARRGRHLLAGLAAILIAAGPSPFAHAQSTLAEAIRDEGGPRDVRTFYAARDGAPLWVRGGVVSPAAEALLRLIESAELDGLDPDDYRPRPLIRALERAESGEDEDLARAELLLTRTMLDIAEDMARPRDVGVVYVDAELRPKPLSGKEVLARAAAAKSLERFVEQTGWMHPLYGRLRAAATAAAGSWENSWRGGEREKLRLNLDRARALPPIAADSRYVLVDAAAARLWMVEGTETVGTMRVVVGKPEEPTPLMAAKIRYASLNPYWNIPPDLVRTRVAPEVVKGGVKYLKAKGYQVLSDWSAAAKPVNPSTIDWRAVQSGGRELRVRQLPGPTNGMGRMKFMFPNQLGVYLHDTPDKGFFKKGERMFSAGCVRLEDAPRLARWLFGRSVSAKGGKPEQNVDLPEPVPVFITYLTVSAGDDGQLVYRDDVYSRDGTELAMADR